MASSRRRIRNTHRIFNSAMSMDFARLIRANKGYIQQQAHIAAFVWQGDKRNKLSNKFDQKPNRP